MRVMVSGTTDDERVVGALHDVVEDSTMSLHTLRQHGFPAHIVNAVDAITRRHAETYAEYIQRVKANPLATAVKVHDLRDNLARGEAYPSLEKRYRKALAELSVAASERGE